MVLEEHNELDAEQLCMHGSMLKELSAPLARAETHQIGSGLPGQ